MNAEDPKLINLQFDDREVEVFALDLGVHPRQEHEDIYDRVKMEYPKLRWVRVVMLGAKENNVSHPGHSFCCGFQVLDLDLALAMMKSLISWNSSIECGIPDAPVSGWEKLENFVVDLIQNQKCMLRSLSIVSLSLQLPNGSNGEERIILQRQANILSNEIFPSCPINNPYVTADVRRIEDRERSKHRNYISEKYNVIIIGL